MPGPVSPSPPSSATCAFCAIVSGRTPAHVVLDDDVVLAFLDSRPLFPGHTLVIPRNHHETLADLPVEAIGPYFERVQRLARVMEAGLGAAGSFVAENNRVSQSVPHLHVHVVPRNRKDGLRGFFWPRTRYPDEATAAAMAERIRDALVSSTDVPR
ncbi:MAG: HIT family protein [Acidimicrobiales bacterium]